MSTWMGSQLEYCQRFPLLLTYVNAFQEGLPHKVDLPWAAAILFCIA